MPQTSDERRARWPGMDREAIEFLTDRGYVLRRDWKWNRPSPDHRPSPREIDALVYLIAEWDFDGAVGA